MFVSVWEVGRDCNKIVFGLLSEKLLIQHHSLFNFDWNPGSPVSTLIKTLQGGSCSGITVYKRNWVGFHAILYFTLHLVCMQVCMLQRNSVSLNEPILQLSHFNFVGVWKKTSFFPKTSKDSFIFKVAEATKAIWAIEYKKVTSFKPSHIRSLTMLLCTAKALH